jgi:hypothetical protein
MQHVVTSGHFKCVTSYAVSLTIALRHTLKSGIELAVSLAFINQKKVKVMLRPTAHSASPSWNKAPIWGLRPDLYYCQTVAGLLMWGALSDERTGLLFARLSQQ